MVLEQTLFLQRLMDSWKGKHSETLTRTFKDTFTFSLSVKSRQNLASSATKLVNIVFLNQSKIFIQDTIIFVDNTSLTYKPTLDKCRPGYQISKNGIFCGKK